MKALTCARMVKERLSPDDLVVCGLGGTEAAMKEVGEAAPTYYASDPMGLWPSVALGLALAQPERRVFFLAGDGDLMMNLQCLITIAAAAPRNLRIILFQNNAYASTGGQRLAGVDAVSFSGIAASSGFTWTAEAFGEADTEQRLGEIFDLEQLGFLAIHLEDVDAPHLAPGSWSQVEERAFFMRQVKEQVRLRGWLPR